MKGRPGPDGLNELRGAAANDGAPDDDALAAVLVHGLKQARVVLADRDPRWARRFAARATELRRVLGERARPVEHVGSTAVPGLPAKPVVDILVGIDDPDDEAAYLPDLDAAGSDLKVREPQHRCLRAGDPGDPVNLHCYPPGHPEIRKLRLFRDHLRRNARDRRAGADLTLEEAHEAARACALHILSTLRSKPDRWTKSHASSRCSAW